jgi:hypothetical protein
VDEIDLARYDLGEDPASVRLDLVVHGVRNSPPKHFDPDTIKQADRRHADDPLHR